MPPKVDSIDIAPYKVGYSFRNPKIVKPITHTRERPFFAMDWAIKGPAQVKEELYRKGHLHRFPSVWRRAAKTRRIERLGSAVLSRKEVPSFSELGQAPGPTDGVSTTSTVNRGWWGALNSALKTAGEVISQRQQLEVARVQAQSGTQFTTLPTSYTPPSGGGGLGMLGWAAIIGVAGVGAYMFMRR